MDIYEKLEYLDAESTTKSRNGNQTRLTFLSKIGLGYVRR